MQIVNNNMYALHYFRCSEIRFLNVFAENIRQPFHITEMADSFWQIAPQVEIQRFVAFNKCSKAAVTCWNHLFLLRNFFIWVEKEDMEAPGAKLGPSSFPLYHIAKREWRTYYIISPIWKLISGKFADRRVLFFLPPLTVLPLCIRSLNSFNSFPL